MNFFKKIYNFFKRLLSKKDDIKLLAEKPKDVTDKEEIIENKKEEKVIGNEVTDKKEISQSEKEYYKKMYEEYKAGIIPVERILISDLIKMYDVMLTEQELVENKISKIDKKLNEQRDKIDSLKKEAQALQDT